MKKRRVRVSVLVVLVLFVLSMTMILATDTNWGKIEMTRMTLTSADGDEISAMLYKPKTATPKTPAPCVMYCHGGNDMLEQGSSYAVELARRGYVVVSWDYTGTHYSDVPTGTSETVVDKVSGLSTMGAETVWNTVKSFNFVDFKKIVSMGHSMGGMYTMGFAIKHQSEVFLQVNIGMNNYGAPTNKEHNFNFVLILGDSDESGLSRSNNSIPNLFKVEQLKRVFAADYTSPAASVPEIKMNQVYSVKGTDGNTYTRTGYMPNSCHAYYLVNQETIRTIVYAITSQVGVGKDAGVSSYADLGKISTVWQWKDLGFILMLACVVTTMFVAASALFKTKAFESLKLKPSQSNVGFKRKSAMWYVAFAILFILPVALYRVGMLSSTKFLGIDISKIWLLGGTSNSYVAWQWMAALGMLVFFLIYHFVWGKKQGGNAKSYGFLTSDDGKFKIGYILKAFLFGLITVGSGYLMFALIEAYTQQGMHIATFMMSRIEPNRTMCIVMYFIFLIPYFLTSSLALKSIGLLNTENNVKGTVKSIILGTVVTVGGLLLLWIGFMFILNNGNTLTNIGYFALDRFYIYTIAILPLFIGMLIANSLNIYVAKKTNSIWSGLFTALLWGTWMIICTGGMTKYFY